MVGVGRAVCTVGRVGCADGRVACTGGRVGCTGGRVACTDGRVLAVEDRLAVVLFEDAGSVLVTLFAAAEPDLADELGMVFQARS